MTERYYSEEDIEKGVTPSQLKRIGRQRQLPYLIYWFHRNFQDPAHETPYESAEGGYLYVLGGPYDAKSELDQEFARLVSAEVIDAAVEEVESDGILNWAPGHDHPAQREREEQWEDADYEPPTRPTLSDIIRELEGGAQPRYGDEFELQQRADLLGRLNRIEETLASFKPRHGRIGHNRPPVGQPDESAGSSETVEEANKATQIIRGELVKPTPDALTVARTTSRLRDLLDWFLGKADKAVDKIAERAGDALVVGVGVVGPSVVHALEGMLQSFVGAMTTWLTHVTLPF
jgi:hypothetical protein